MTIDKNIFRAYDIRGIYGQNLTDQILAKIGFIVAAKNEKIVVGNDIRSSSLALASALISGLKKAGADVIYIGTAPYGQTLYGGMHFKSSKTLFITASHLPPEWNGLKIYHGDGVGFMEDEIQEVYNKVLVLNVDLPINKNLEAHDIKQEYLNFLKQKFKITKKFSIVVDPGNGSMCLSAPHAFEPHAEKLVRIFDVADPSSPNRVSEPNPENLSILREKVLSESADIGVAFDGDGDRSTIVDDKGNFWTGNELGLLIGEHMLNEHGAGTIINTVSCSMSAKKLLEPKGAKVITVPVGHTFVGQNVKKHSAIFGFEESNHIFMPQYAYHDDALFIPLKILEILSQSGKKLSDYRHILPDYSFQELVFKCPDEVKFDVVSRIRTKLAQKHSQINAMDGVKVEFEDGWALIRAANTSPKIRLYVEATTPERFAEIKREFSDVLTEELKAL